MLNNGGKDQPKVTKIVTIITVAATVRVRESYHMARRVIISSSTWLIFFDRAEDLNCIWIQLMAEIHDQFDTILILDFGSQVRWIRNSFTRMTEKPYFDTVQSSDY